MPKKVLASLLLISGFIPAFCQSSQPVISPDSILLKRSEQIQELIRHGNLDEAGNQLRRWSGEMESNASPTGSAIINTAYGALYLNSGRNDLALEYLQRALDAWDAAGMLNSLSAAETQAYLGNLYRAAGKYQEAEELLSVVLLTRKKWLPSHHQAIAAALNDLGLIFTSSDPDRALDFYEQALEIYQLNSENDEKIAISKTNIAFLYSQLELYGDAIVNLESALDRWNTLHSGAHAGKAFVLLSLGTTYEKMRDLGKAETYYLQSLEAYNQLYGARHPDVARVHNSLGNLSRARGKFDAALLHYQQAIIANHPELQSRDISTPPPTDTFYDGNVLLYSLMYKAEALEQRYLRKTLRLSDLGLALRTLQSCDSLISSIRNQITSESDKLALGAIASDVYADGVRISMVMAQEALSKLPYYELAFFFSEKSKAAVLLGALSDANAKAFSGIPPTVLEEERNLKSAMALCSQKLAQKPNDSEERDLRQTLYNLSRAYRTFSDRLEKDYPAYFNLKFNNATPSINELKERLSVGTMVISYFIDDKNRMLYTFTITRKRFSVTERALPEGFDRSITGFRNSMYYSEARIFSETAENLSRLLLPAHIPVEIKEIVVIPASRLSTIPFEALLVSKPTDVRFEKLDYLVRHYSVRYEFSCGLITQKRENRNQDTSSILLCAPVNFHNSSIPDLPGSEQEVREIASTFQAHKLVTRVLLYDSAYKANVQRANLNQYAYLHFATHGMVDEIHPDLSGIFFSGDSQGGDYRLYASEIYNLDLNSDLVTLSACETGLGKFSKGEGVIGLSRALVYAGARSCMVSLWKVADEATSTMMKTYYARLLDSPNRNLSATLQATKLRMLEDPRYSPPFYWASFVLIGY